MNNRLGRKIIFFIIILFLPFSLIYIFSKGSQHYKRLPFLGPAQSDSTPFVFSDFSFRTSDGRIIDKKDLQGKILIVTALNSTCPGNCLLAANPFKLEVYNLIQDKDFADVVILSELLDTNEVPFNLMHEKMKVDPERWTIFTTAHNPFWDVELNGSVLRETPDPDSKVAMFYPRAILLVDTSFRPRGFYDGAETIEIKRLIDELRLLKKEYDQKLN
ncbi:MAG: hypothetical protein K1X56_02340 [Flavobacteriales bacterium]|nr:hypothetical protein [Flavobacteriales bacterium]